MKRTIRTHTICAILLAAAFAQTVLAEVIYWTDFTNDKVLRTDLDTMVTEDLVIGAEKPIRIAIDPIGRKMYWVSNSLTQSIKGLYWANLDGTGVERIGTAIGNVIGVDLDLVGQKVYWHTINGTFKRANLDGSSPETILTNTFAQDFSIEPVTRKLYLGGGDFVKRADLDGSNLEVVRDELRSEVVGVSVDPYADRIYFGNFDFTSRGGRLQAMNLDGTGLTTIVNGIDIDSVKLNPARDKIYFGTLNAAATTGAIYRVNIDGTGFEDLNLPGGSPGGVAWVPEPSAALLMLALLAIGPRSLRRAA